jgi:hypothetical protein
MLTTGISINKVDALRTWLEHATKKSIGPAGKLLSTYVKDLLKSEIAQQKEELANSAIAIIFDATPRLGDFFAMVARHIDLNSDIKRAIAKQTLFHCSAIQGSLNGDTLMGEVTRGLGKRGLSHSNAVVAMNDGCYTNGAAHDKMKSVSDDAGDVSRFVSLCISHAANNAGAEASFILLALFWSLIQKIFSQSDKAKQNWKDVTETSWKSYSETRWYSKYEVIESISFFFPDMLTVITKNVKDGISPRNSAKLLNLLLDERKNLQLQVEMAAYVEALFDLRNLCYYL